MKARLVFSAPAASAIALGLITMALMVISGCAGQAHGRTNGGGSPQREAATAFEPMRAPARVIRNEEGAGRGRDGAMREGDRDRAVREAAASELGPEVAAALPEIADGPAAQPIDPGAEMIVRAIANRLPQRPVDNRGVTVVDLCQVHNHSRASHGEFAEAKQRLAALLSAAGREHKIEFMPDRTGDEDGQSAEAGDADEVRESHYHMQGAAYLITAGGFDQWELFLSLTPADRDFTVWDARSAIRMLRIPRPGLPQITYIGPPR